MEMVNIQMLGGFSLSTDSKKISDRDNRSRKVWTLLAYLIYHRHRVVSQDELINLLWTEDEQGANPAGALKTMFHRARTTLDGLWPSAGMQLINRQGAGYIWSKDVPITVDVDEFDRLCRKADDPEEQLQRAFQALQFYKGGFLPNMTSESWVIPVATYYHNCYIQKLMEILPELLQQGQFSDVVELCKVASNVEPYHEEIHCYLMRAMIASGDRKDAVGVYKKLSERLFSNFGILPSDDTRALYYEAIKTQNDHAIQIEILQEQLKEDFQEGALICEYDFFRVLYRSMARSMARNGIAAHIALLTMVGKRGVDMTQKKLETAMKKLEDQIRTSLRRGDAGSQCSVSQFVILLPKANYENSCMVCDRILRAYTRKYPHSDADIQYAVYPIQPDDKEVVQWIQEKTQN